MNTSPSSGSQSHLGKGRERQRSVLTNGWCLVWGKTLLVLVQVMNHNWAGWAWGKKDSSGSGDESWLVWLGFLPGVAKFFGLSLSFVNNFPPSLHIPGPGKLSLKSKIFHSLLGSEIVHLHQVVRELFTGWVQPKEQ